MMTQADDLAVVLLYASLVTTTTMCVAQSLIKANVIITKF